MLALSLVAMVWWTLLFHCLFNSELLGEDHVFFSGPLEFPPQTVTNFVMFLDIFHIFSPHKRNFSPKITSLEKTLGEEVLVTEFSRFSCKSHKLHSGNSDVHLA